MVMLFVVGVAEGMFVTLLICDVVAGVAVLVVVVAIIHISCFSFGKV